MYKILFQSLGKSILLKSNSIKAKKHIHSNIVPNIFVQDLDIKVIETITFEPDIEIKHMQSEENEIYIDFDKRKYLILDDWKEKVPTSFFSFIQFLFTSLLLNQSTYTLHASAVQGKSYNFIFTGGAGSGKTSTMLELVTKHNYSFISNNKVSVSVNNKILKVVGGTKGITIRESDNFDKYRKVANANFQKIYAGRTAFMFKDKLSANLNVSKKICIFSLKINTGVEEFRKLSEEESVIYLYPVFIESVDREVLLFNWSEPVPFPYDEYVIKKKALKDLRDTLPSIEVYHLSGSMDFITKKVNELDRD